MRGFLALAGGWWSADEEPLLREFTKGVRRLLYWPFALAPARHPQLIDYLAECLEPFGVTEIETWSTLEGRTPAELAGFDAIWLGGGSTYRLLHHLRQHGFTTALAAFTAAGGRVYGGSAGAVLLGSDIAIAESQDVNEVGLTDTTGLGLLGDLAVWVHYEPEQAAQVREWSTRRGVPVLALPDRSGAVVADGVVTCVGYEPFDCFTADGQLTTRHWTL